MLDKVKRYGCSSLEINLNPLLEDYSDTVLSYKKVEDFIINSTEHKNRIYNKREEEFEEKHIEYAKVKLDEQKKEQERKKKGTEYYKKKDIENGIIGKASVTEYGMDDSPIYIYGHIDIYGENEAIKLDRNTTKKYANQPDYFINMKLRTNKLTVKGDYKWERQYAGTLKRINDTELKGKIARKGKDIHLKFIENEEFKARSADYLIKALS